jgi:hypothetical protein
MCGFSPRIRQNSQKSKSLSKHFFSSKLLFFALFGRFFFFFAIFGRNIMVKQKEVLLNVHRDKN